MLLKDFTSPCHAGLEPASAATKQTFSNAHTTVINGKSQSEYRNI
jgi:hypothetical protein